MSEVDANEQKQTFHYENQIGFYHGDDLKNAVSCVSVVREPLIEHLLYKKSAHMIFAPDGVGKSVIGLQMCAQATVDDAKVFGEYHVPKGVRVLYIQMERHEDECFERLKAMSTRIPINWENLVITTKLQGLNISDKTDFNQAMNLIGQIIDYSMHSVDLIHIDPIYALVGNDLTSNKDIAPLGNLSRMLQQKYLCSMQFVHHANRGARNKDTGLREGVDMFGSRFLSAHFTGIYKIEAASDESGTTLTADKSSQKNLDKKIDLVFDPESQLSWVKPDHAGMTKIQRLNQFLRSCKENKKTFTFDDLKANSLLSTAYLRTLVVDTRASEFKVVSKGLKNKNIYEYLGV